MSSIRDKFECLGVPEYALAQIIWSEFEDRDYSAPELIEFARRLLPDDLFEMVVAQLREARRLTAEEKLVEVFRHLIVSRQS